MTRNVALARAWLGSLFVYSAGLKLAQHDHGRSSVKGYKLLPARLATPAGLLLPWVELLTALSLLLGRFYPLGPLLGAFLGTSFASSSFAVLRQKADVPCGCTGNIDDRVSRTTFIRGLALQL